MINLRYHIVSITAVFLALGIGITMGSTFLGKATLDRIDNNVKDARERVREVNEENSELRRQVNLSRSRSADLTEAALGRMFTDMLTDVPVVLVAAEGVDRDSLRDLQVALTASGASFDGTLTATDKFALTGGDAEDLAEILGGSADEVGQLRRAVTDELADELLAAAEPPVLDEGEGGGEGEGEGDGTATTTLPEGATTVPTETLPADTTVPPSDPAATTVPGAPPASETTLPTTTTTVAEPILPPALVSTLVSSGFLDYEPALGGAAIDQLLVQQGYRYVVVTGPTADLTDPDFVQPLVKALAADGPAPVVVASAAVADDPQAMEEVRSSSLTPLISDELISNRITTVDDLEEFSGIAAVVLSVQDLAQGRHGHYGVGDDADTQLPTSRG